MPVHRPQRGGFAVRRGEREYLRRFERGRDHLGESALLEEVGQRGLAPPQPARRLEEEVLGPLRGRREGPLLEARVQAVHSRGASRPTQPPIARRTAVGCRGVSRRPSLPLRARSRAGARACGCFAERLDQGPCAAAVAGSLALAFRLRAPLPVPDRPRGRNGQGKGPGSGLVPDGVRIRRGRNHHAPAAARKRPPETLPAARDGRPVQLPDRSTTKRRL